MPKIYISGKITGLDREEYLAKFDLAEKRLISEGYDVVNPARTNDTLPAKSTTYQQFMDMSMLMLSMCDGIYMLNDWGDSPGARSEKEWAEKHGLKIRYQWDDTEKILNEICDHYCRFPEAYPENENDRMIEERCNKCPLVGLMK